MLRLSASRLSLLAALATGVAWVSPALAQEATTSDQAAELGEVIVTGRAGAAQKKVEASYAISTISEADLQIRAPVGVGEALKNVPGFWIENSSGEASGNIRVRGIPNDGYSTVGLLEDGIAAQADAGLGWLNADQSMRVDQTAQRVEVVRGGPSSIFYSNAPGAVINFITRRGGETLEGLARYEASDYNSHRLDGWVGGPIGDTDWRFLVGGYYRLSDGLRDTGYRQDEGGQIRATLSRDFDHGSPSFDQALTASASWSSTYRSDEAAHLTMRLDKILTSRAGPAGSSGPLSGSPSSASTRRAAMPRPQAISTL